MLFMGFLNDFFCLFIIIIIIIIIYFFQGRPNPTYLLRFLFFILEANFLRISSILNQFNLFTFDVLTILHGLLFCLNNYYCYYLKVAIILCFFPFTIIISFLFHYLVIKKIFDCLVHNC